MKQQLLTIKENNIIAENIFELILEGDIDEHLPGQFVNIKIPGKYLRRPVSVCDCKEGRLTLCYKTVGEGTKILSTLKTGEKIDVLTGLGNGYDLEPCGDKPLLIGGGMGCAPLYFLARKLTETHTSLEVIMGFNTENDIYYRQKFADLGCNVHIATVDGSFGEKGFATDIIPDEYSYFYSCGPLPMMKAVNKTAKTSGQFSLEDRMGCGFGACMGCSLKTKEGYKRICKDGPVFKKEEIIWED